MKTWITLLAFGGLLATTGMVETTVQPATPQAADDELPCGLCCPVHICGLNGPSLDGTTADELRPSR